MKRSAGISPTAPAPRDRVADPKRTAALLVLTGVNTYSSLTTVTLGLSASNTPPTAILVSTAAC